jgi:P63C domain
MYNSKHYKLIGASIMGQESNGDSAQKLGGLARAQNLTKERRSEIAKKAAEAKWGGNMLQAEFEGDVKIAGGSIPAAVLPNGKRLLNQGQFLQAIGRARTPKAGTGGLTVSVDGLPFFLQADVLKPYITNELRESTTPILFRNKQGRRAVGYDAALLPKVCEVYLKFRDGCAIEGKSVPKQYDHIVKACDIVMRGLAEIGVIALVDEATGYQYVRDREALQEHLEKFLRKELAVWVKTFPDEFYQEMYRLRGWQWRGMQVNRISACSGYTRDLVYDRLAKDLVQKLEEKNPMDAAGNRKAKHWQWLSDDLGNPALKAHLHTLINFMKAYDDWDEFYLRLNRALPRKGHSLMLALDEPNSASMATRRRSSRLPRADRS